MAPTALSVLAMLPPAVLHLLPVGVGLLVDHLEAAGLRANGGAVGVDIAELSKFCQSAPLLSNVCSMQFLIRSQSVTWIRLR